MPSDLPVGPYKTLDISDGTTAPWYIMPFDKHGRCTGPLTRAEMLDRIRANDFTDIYLFSHGWNNDWKQASKRYDHFIKGYGELRFEQKLSINRDYRPLLIGIFWPSASLVLPWEGGPKIAAAGQPLPEDQDDKVADEQRQIEEIAECLQANQVARFYELAQKRELGSAAEALEFAEILSLVRSNGDAELPESAQAWSPNEVLQLWTAASSANTGDQSGGFGRLPSTTTAGPNMAGLFSALNPRHAIRLTTVWMMKDRAGTVGAVGVSEMLHDVLHTSKARMHLIGHSYGAKVVLSAICIKKLPRTINSVLLLQPAVSHLCFAEDATGKKQPGGYRGALNAVEQPILLTFSSCDVPLTRVFHTAVRRASDIGEMRIAGMPPSRYAALGGFGASGVGAQYTTMQMAQPPIRYQLNNDPNVRVIGLDGSNAIAGHGEVSNSATWWALFQQVAQ